MNKNTGFCSAGSQLSACLVARGKIIAVFFQLAFAHIVCIFFWVSFSGFGSSFLPKEESVTAAPEVEVSEDYQASSQVCLNLFKILHIIILYVQYFFKNTQKQNGYSCCNGQTIKMT